MDEAAIIRYIAETFDGVEVVEASEDSFFMYDPGHLIPVNRRFPFATLVTGDRHDTVSNLDRPGVFRLNIGVGKETFRSLFGAEESPADSGGTAGDYDFTALDRLMPHPVYGRMYWSCVLNPGEATWPMAQALLAEAYEMAVARRAKFGSADEQR